MEPQYYLHMKLLILLDLIFSICLQLYGKAGEISKTDLSGKDGHPSAYSDVREVTRSARSSPIRISKENHIHKMSINNKPCVTVKSGTRLILECQDGLEGRSKEYFNNKTPYSEIFPIANPGTGPVFIEDALPGDVLEVEIHDIRLSGLGYIQLNKNQFVDNTPWENVYAEAEIKGTYLLYNGLKMPIQPMVGTIGTAGLKEIYCQENGDNGGNMDARLIKKHSKVLLPVFAEGGLLAMGDLHAVMGDGEVFGQGVEIGGEVEITVRVRKDLKIQRPMVFLTDRIASIASNADILAAKDQAINDMGKFLVDMCGFNSIDASSLIAFYGNLAFCQVVTARKTVRMEIEKKYIRLFNPKTLPL